MNILILNSGSSSLKYQVINMENEEVLVNGYYEKVGSAGSFLSHKAKGEKFKFENEVADHKEALEIVISKITDKECGVLKSLDEINAVGHRVVHGGEKFKESVIIDNTVLEEIRKCAELAPLHNPPAILGIEACMDLIPEIPMVAVFDTSFHQTIPEHRYIYPVPYKYYKDYKVRKYGFHGTSHKYVANRVAEMIGKPIEELKIISCHLGQGASICAVDKGISVETSMGFTPLGGIPMGSRCGDIDPSIVLYLMEKEGISFNEMNNILNKNSGLYGISEISPDARDIEAAMADGHKNSKLALDNYHYLVACYMAKAAVAMNGVDVITFTAGTGERGIETREELCKHLTFLGVEIDIEANNVKAEERLISTQNSKVQIYVVPTNEELMIARETKFLVNNI